MLSSYIGICMKKVEVPKMDIGLGTFLLEGKQHDRIQKHFATL